MENISYYISKIKESEYRKIIIDIISRFFFSENIIEYQIICALHNTEVIGFIVFDYKADICIVHYAYILPQFRNKHAATNLFRKLCELNKSIHKYTLNLLVYDDRKFCVNKFWYSLGFKDVGIDCLGYFVKKTDWDSNVEPRLRILSADNFYSMKDYKAIYNEKRLEIEEYVNSKCVPDYFSPEFSEGYNKSCNCYYDSNDQLIGWTIIEHKNKFLIEFVCTYIVETHRNLKTLCTIWKMISRYIKLNFPSIKYLIFYYDGGSFKLKNMYHFFFRHCMCKHFKRTVLQYEIPIL